MWTRETWYTILNWLRKVRMSRRSNRACRTVHYAKPQLESLTERIVPSNTACTFTGAVSSAWDNAANWVGNNMPDDTGPSTAAPPPTSIT